MLSPPKPLDKIQSTLVCELLTCMGLATALFCPAAWDQKVNIIKFQLIWGELIINDNALLIHSFFPVIQGTFND